MYHGEYWSCSSFANWLGGSEKPPYATGEGWDEFNSMASAKHPIRFWMADVLLDGIQDVVCYPYRVGHSAKCYITNRYITKSHALTADKRDITPGSWYDVGDRFLPCCFNELVDFVEIEAASMQLGCGDGGKKYKKPWISLRPWRCKEAGMAYLVWASNLITGGCFSLLETDADYYKPTAQASAALEILALYEWFTMAYRNRPDPYDLLGDDWSHPVGRNVVDQIHQIEKDNKQEETDMLIRLVNIRDHLWT